MFRRLAYATTVSFAAIIAFIYFSGRAILTLITRLPSTLHAISSKTVVRIWIKNSTRLFTVWIAYNLFAVFIVEPILKWIFPPLSMWEHVSGTFTGDSRLTYEQLMPFVARILWILGNGLIIALLNYKLLEVQDEVSKKSV